MIKDRIAVRRAALFAVPVLLLMANAQFAYVSYRHAESAHAEMEIAARAHNGQGVSFWKAMEAEEGGEYTDSIHFGLGLLVGIALVGSWVAWHLSRRRRIMA